MTIKFREGTPLNSAQNHKKSCFIRIFTIGNRISPMVVIPIASAASLPAKRSAGKDPSFSKVSHYPFNDKILHRIRWILHPTSRDQNDKTKICARRGTKKSCLSFAPETASISLLFFMGWSASMNFFLRQLCFG